MAQKYFKSMSEAEICDYIENVSDMEGYIDVAYIPPAVDELMDEENIDDDVMCNENINPLDSIAGELDCFVRQGRRISSAPKILPKK